MLTSTQPRRPPCGVLLDQSMLTAESVPVEAGPGRDAYAGALVRRGEAAAVVTATGPRTKFGRTAELVRTARAASTGWLLASSVADVGIAPGLAMVKVPVFARPRIV